MRFKLADRYPGVAGLPICSMLFEMDPFKLFYILHLAKNCLIVQTTLSSQRLLHSIISAMRSQFPTRALEDLDSRFQAFMNTYELGPGQCGTAVRINEDSTCLLIHFAEVIGFYDTVKGTSLRPLCVGPDSFLSCLPVERELLIKVLFGGGYLDRFYPAAFQKEYCDLMINRFTDHKFLDYQVWNIKSRLIQGHIEPYFIRSINFVTMLTELQYLVREFGHYVQIRKTPSPNYSGVLRHLMFASQLPVVINLNLLRPRVTLNFFGSLVDWLPQENLPTQVFSDGGLEILVPTRIAKKIRFKVDGHQLCGGRLFNRKHLYRCLSYHFVIPGPHRDRIRVRDISDPKPCCVIRLDVKELYNANVAIIAQDGNFIVRLPEIGFDNSLRYCYFTPHLIKDGVGDPLVRDEYINPKYDFGSWCVPYPKNLFCNTIELGSEALESFQDGFEIGGIPRASGLGRSALDLSSFSGRRAGSSIIPFPFPWPGAGGSHSGSRPD